MNVCCVFSLESPHRGDFNEYTQHTIFNILNLPLWDFSKGLKGEFETAVVNEPSVFEPLKFYCMSYARGQIFRCTGAKFGRILRPYVH